jgi:hypothetical protein
MEKKRIQKKDQEFQGSKESFAKTKDENFRVQE